MSVLAGDGRVPELLHLKIRLRYRLLLLASEAILRICLQQLFEARLSVLVVKPFHLSLSHQMRRKLNWQTL